MLFDSDRLPPQRALINSVLHSRTNNAGAVAIANRRYRLHRQGEYEKRLLSTRVEVHTRCHNGCLTGCAWLLQAPISIISKRQGKPGSGSMTYSNMASALPACQRHDVSASELPARSHDGYCPF